MADSSPASLPYEEPDILTILIQSSFLLVLNIINYILDRTLYCGLLGQVFIGVAWGSPGGQWLSTHTEETIVQSGYLGLLLLVYEGSSLCLYARTYRRSSDLEQAVFLHPSPLSRPTCFFPLV